MRAVTAAPRHLVVAVTVRFQQRRAARRRPLCPSVEEWAADRGIEARVVLPARHTIRRLPRTIEAEIDEQYLRHQVHDHRKVCLVPIAGARVFGRNGLVMLPDGSVAAEATNGREVLENDPDYYANRRRPVVAKRGSYFSMITSWSGHNYYHWIHDSLQRLSCVIEQLPPDTNYIVPANPTPVQRETLRLFGIDDRRIFPFTGDEIWELQTLLFTPPITWAAHSRPEGLVGVRDRILEEYGITPRPSGRKLYVSRRNASVRRLVNDAAVDDFLRERGFETVLCESLSFREQVETFAEAECVVAPHGAGLTNILFSATGLRIIEILEPGIMANAPCYWTMADVLGHEYWYFVAEAVIRPGQQNDTRVPLEQLSAILTAMAKLPSP